MVILRKIGSKRSTAIFQIFILLYKIQYEFYIDSFEIREKKWWWKLEKD